MCEVIVFLPEGHRLPLTFPEEILKMTAGYFYKELAKQLVVLRLLSEYTEDTFRLIIGNKPVDNGPAPISDYGIKSGTALQMVRRVNGG